MAVKKILVFDTTLRDGSQAEKINFTVEDKVKIAEKLDSFGIDYIEGGWPGSNPRDIGFFEAIRKIKLKHALITAFGSTRHKKNTPANDPNIRAILKTGVRCATLFGKSWDLHVKYALKATLDQNLEMIYDSVKYLKSRGLEVVYDAEHFFDGYDANPEYALKTLEAAQSGGADNITLAETNGGRLPFEVDEAVHTVRKKIDTPLGIHAHNDSGCAVANSLMAVQAGAVMVQGTMNGFGERCGNADLTSILPALKLKMNRSFHAAKNLKRLTELSRFISETANLPHEHRLPYVGDSAFAHKGGIHVSAVQRDSRTYEHIEPELVGNHRRVLISDQSGRSNINFRFQELGIKLTEKNQGSLKVIVDKIKDLESKGFEFESADASLELLIREALGSYKPVLNISHIRLIIERTESDRLVSEGVVKITMKGREQFEVAEGDGPVNAVDNALRKALAGIYPGINRMKLIDYKVRVLGQTRGTGSLVRVLIESQVGAKTWRTVGVSENVIDASLQALVDSIEYLIMKKY